MRIGGIQPVTLLDYPNKIAAIIFTSGCNMRCSFCYNFKLVLPELINPDQLYSEKDIIDFLARRKRYLDGLVVSGGEPTLQDDLPEFLAKMKEIGYDIKIDTNGLRPDVLSGLIKRRLIDYIAMDIKGPLDHYEKFSGVPSAGVTESIALAMKSGLPYEFRSTLVKGLHEPEDIKAMSKAIAGAELYYLQAFRPETVLAGDKFFGQAFLEAEMSAMRAMAAKNVVKCEIR